MLRWFAYVMTLSGIGVAGILLVQMALRKLTPEMRGVLVSVGIGCLLVGMSLLYFLGEYPFGPGI